RVRNLIHGRPARWLGGGAVVAVIGIAVGVAVTERQVEPESRGTPASMRLLTQQQYLNMLAYAFGPDVQPMTRFAALPRTAGLLTSGAAIAGITDSQLEVYQKTASTVAEQVIGEDSRKYLVPCVPAKIEAADP